VYNGVVMLFGPVTPIIIRSVGQPTDEVGVMDVLLQALGLTGALLLASLLLGLVLGGIFIAMRKRRGSIADGNDYGFKLDSNEQAPSS
jgi:ABC-type amino acid transport system permease subunit